MSRPLQVCHVAIGLGVGGAETVLCQLIERSDRQRFNHSVVSLTRSGPIAARLEAMGIPVVVLGMRRSPGDVWALLRLVRLLNRLSPDVVHTWMYHADFFGGIAARLAGCPTVVWALHHTDLRLGLDSLTTQLIARSCALLSPIVPKTTVSCSVASKATHVKMGYAERRIHVIPNGIDLGRFRPDASARLDLRRALGLTAETPLVGMAARFHPQKDHRTFLEAAKLLRGETPVHFVLWGNGVDDENPALRAWLEETGGHANVHLLGLRQDTPRLLAGLDVACLSSSHGEAFPLAIGEAMACGIPCVVTDVGDAARLVADTGVVVPPSQPQALMEGWKRLLVLDLDDKARLGLMARRRIEQHFRLETMVDRYETLYRELSDGRHVAKLGRRHASRE